MNDDLDMQILQLNGLSYPAPSELSLASSHKLRVFPALRQSYSAGTSGYVDLTPGSDVVSCTNSFVEFKLKVTSGDATAIILPEIGALSVFNETVVRDRAGAELDRAQHNNLYIRDHVKSHCTYGTMSTLGSAMAPNETITSGTEITVCIPLMWINPIFSSSRLLPTNIIGSLRLEFVFANAIEALISTADTPLTFEVNDLNVWLDCYSLADSALRSLSMIAANSGLNYPWESQHCTVSTSDGNYTNVVSLKSASRALGASLHISESDTLTTNNLNSLHNETFVVAQSQWSLGSNYMPVKKLDTTAAHFYNTLYAVDALGHCREFASELTFGEFIADYGTLNTTLERSGVIDAQGSATSSSRPLIADVQWATAVSRTTFLFLRYKKVLISFADGATIVKE
jgi:hypothetical protein